MIEDTFLVNSKEMYPESSIKINCIPHNAPAVFYSRQQNQYKCFKCLVGEQDLIYIDKRFKKEMEDYETIKMNSGNAIRDNMANTRLIKDWKLNIRKTLFEVKEKFTEWIDNYTNKFVKSLNRIEYSKELAEFVNEDSKLESQVRILQDYYLEIQKIFFQISKAGPAEKLEKIEGFRPEMRKLESDINKLDKQIKK